MNFRIALTTALVAAAACTTSNNDVGAVADASLDRAQIQQTAVCDDLAQAAYAEFRASFAACEGADCVRLPRAGGLACWDSCGWLEVHASEATAAEAKVSSVCAAFSATGCQVLPLPCPLRGLPDAAAVDASDLGSADASTCTWPAQANPGPGGAGSTGCVPDTTAQICLQEGGVNSCQYACAANQYHLTCTGTFPTGPIPAPASSLNCTIIPGPTPSNVLAYCCPCQ